MTYRRTLGVLIGVAVLVLAGLRPRCEAIQTVASTASEPPSVQQDDAEKSRSIPPREPTKVIRLQRDEFGNPIALQTATKKFVLKNDKGDVELEVILESVIHLADNSYYRGFQQRFERYDTVLYELVTEQPDRRPTSDELPTGFELLRQISVGSLGLAHQLEAIDYSAANMVHADLTPSEIAEGMKDRGETKTTLLVDLLAHIIKTAGAERQADDVTAGQGGSSEDDAEPPPLPSPLAEAAGGGNEVGEPGGSEPRKPFDLSLLTDPDGIMKIRRMMAAALVDSQLLDSVFPPSIHRLLVSDRNERVMSVLNNERKKGKRQIAIFYGAGHMADFERRLVNEYGMELVDEIWRSAWDLRDGAVAGGPLEGLIESTFRDSIKEKLTQFAKGRQRKSESESSEDQADSDKDAKIKSMEGTLKELEAKLKKLESETNQPDPKTPEKDQPKSKKPGRTLVL